MNPEVPQPEQTNADTPAVDVETQATVDNFPAETAARVDELAAHPSTPPLRMVEFRGMVMTEAEKNKLVNDPNVDTRDMHAGSR